MFTAVMSGLTLRSSLLLTAVFLVGICTKDFVDASSCEVTYIGGDHYIHCRKTTDSLSDLNRTLLVLKYKCDGSEDVYEYCPESMKMDTFEVEDCALTPDTFNFCNDYDIRIYHQSPVDYKNVVLRNGTFGNHRGIHEIILSGNGIETVESGAFGCENNLWYLDMSDNDIGELPDDAFRCLSELTRLDLSNNRISLVPKCLSDLSSLKRLFLSDNWITVFPETALHKSATLKTLDLNRNVIQKFCAAEISQLANLTRLYFRGNNITSLTNKCFVEQKKLYELDMGMNVGLVLANEVFAGMDRLKKLHIDGCGLNIGVEGSAVFSDTTWMDTLHLQYNRLREIHSDLFQKLRALRRLDLSFNAISVLHNGSFAENIQLEYLDLSNNLLSEIKSGEFSRMYSVEVLNISDNNITNVAVNAFDDLKNLKTLNIGNNNIYPMTVHSSVPMHAFQNIFRNLEHLETLDMSNITSWDFQLVFSKKNKTVRHLDVSFNVGLRLDKNSLKNLKNLRTFISRGTNVESLEDLFTFNRKLKEINMSQNKIQGIGPSDLKTKNLQILDLSWNNISELVDDVFSFCENIEYINVSHNAIQKVADGFLPEDGDLYALDISSNRLARIEWNYFHTVDNLWASNNTIHQLLLSDFVSTCFQTVHLEDCKIEKVLLHYNLEMEMGTNSGRTQFFLARNPVVCNCHAFQLYEYIKHRGDNRRFSFEGLTCRRPVELKGWKMEHLLPGDFSCEVLRSCPETCRCLKRAHDHALIVNCSRRDLGRLPEDVPANTTILDVSYNRITSLESLNSSIWENVTEIHAEGNLISSLEFEVPKNVKIFLLRGNRLTKLPERHTAVTRRALQITLSENPWSCGCESSLKLKYFLSKTVGQIPDASEVRCAPSTNSTSNLTLLEMRDEDLCPKSDKKAVSISLIAFLTLLVFGLSVWLYYTKNENFVNAVLVTHCTCMYSLMGCRKVVEEDKTFDCFISYGSEDVDVPLAIVRELGKEPDPEFQFCVHDRHWRGGSTISENIFRSVELSRKTLIVVSRTFVKNKWFYLEFQAALMQMLKDRQDRMIFAIKGDLPDYEHLPRDVRHFLRTRTYLVWGEMWFMEKLRYSLQKESVPFTVQLREFLLVVVNCLRNRRRYHRDLPEEIV